MSGIFGAGIIPGGSSPASYRALIEWFDGDKDAADAWLAAWIGYAATGAEAAALLTALESLGSADTALTVANAASIQVEALTPYAEIDAPIYGGTAYETPAGPIPTPVEKGVF